MPSSPISKAVEAIEYVSLNMRGRSGILLKKPHLFCGASSSIGVPGREILGDCERRLLDVLFGDLEGGEPGEECEAGLGRPGS